MNECDIFPQSKRMGSAQQEEERKIRRRATCRINQRRYRTRLREKSHVKFREIQNWKNKLTALQAYKSLIGHGALLKRVRWMELRGIIVQVFAHVFERGVLIQRCDFQRAFLQFNCDNNLVDYNNLLHQFAKYRMIHQEFQLNFNLVQCLDPTEKLIFQLHLKAEMLIIRATIAAIYPHMLFQQPFMEYVVDKKIQYPFLVRIRFGSRSNKIVSIILEHKLAEGWCNLLKSSTWAAQTIGQCNIDPITTFITMDSVSLHQIVADHSV